MTEQLKATTAKTTKKDVSVFILASRKMPFLGCEQLNNNGFVAFVFEGNQEQLEDFEREFYSGAVAPAIDVIESWRRLSRAMDSPKQHI